MKTTIIGGGLAGLTSLLILARAGRRATLYERAGTLGGRARTEAIGDYSLNLGAHALYRGGAAKKIFDELGIPISGKVAPATGAYALHGGRLHTMPAGLVSMLTTNLLTLPGKLELARTFARIRMLDPQTIAHLSLADWLQANVRDPRVVELMRALFRVSTYVADTAPLSAASAIRQLVLGLLGGVLYLDQGWQTLVEGLRKAAIEAGGEIITGARVQAIEHDDRVRAIVLDDGTRRETDAAILAVSPKIAAELTSGYAKKLLLEAHHAAVPARAACLDVALRSVPVPRARFALGIDVPLYYSLHSATAKLAPDGGAVIHLAKYLSGTEDTNAAQDEQELETLLDLAQPGWRELIVERRFRPQMTVVHAIVPPANPGFKPRLEGPIPGVFGLHVAGDWLGADRHHLTDAAVATGKNAADRLLEQPAAVASMNAA